MENGEYRYSVQRSNTMAVCEYTLPVSNSCLLLLGGVISRHIFVLRRRIISVSIFVVAMSNSSKTTDLAYLTWGCCGAFGANSLLNYLFVYSLRT